jgi:hypothetical protein
MVPAISLPGAVAIEKSDVQTLRFDPGIHLVTGHRPGWDALLSDLRESYGRLILLSPDPPQMNEPPTPTLQRVWFTGTRVRGSVVASSSSLSGLGSRLVQPSSATAVEGIEVLMFWNPRAEVMEFLRSLDSRLIRCSSPGLVYVRPRLLEDADLEALVAQFPLRPELARVGKRSGSRPAEMDSP